ncbi:MAG: 2OG-Fe(II) oxygenase [Deltaproteobacteria bacterium]|nr:2OG-Fe(II) oxygenase [Deltaproteobacteria bacterium]
MTFEARLKDALGAVPAGRTRSISELASTAGRPWAAREAGRLIAGWARNRCTALPLHRAVRSGSGLPFGDRQQRKLVAEGARPRRSEAIDDWLARAGADLVGLLASRSYCRPECALAVRARSEAVEPLTDAREAARRGFRPCARCAPPVRRVRMPDPLRPPGRRPHCASADLPLETQLDRCGHAIIPRILDARECAYFERAAARPSSHRRRVTLERHAFGRGEYGYVGAGEVHRRIETLRRRLYSALLPDARAWLARLGRADDLPDTLRSFDARSAAAGQRLAASTLLQYGAGGWNAPHRDLYGPVIFPFQVVIVVSRAPYQGGSFAVIEARADGKDLWHLVRPRPGDAVIFPSEARPVPRDAGAGRTTQRFKPAPVRHALLPIRAGRRTALGLVLHAARK